MSVVSYKKITDEIKTISENYEDELTGGWITGNGPIPCDILFVGEAPGKTEVEKGKPFVGVAGQILDGYLSSINVSRENIRITNSCFMRPIKLRQYKTGRTTISNRPPTSKEIDMFREVLDEEICLVNPKIIITLGNVPLKRLTKYKSIGECHGTLYFNETIIRYIFPMYHPSALTYNRNDTFMKMYQKDWNKLKEALKSL